MATKQQVIDLNKKHPTWTARDIAEHLDCLVEYVFSCKTRYGLKFAKGNYRERDPNSVTMLGRAARRAGLTMDDIKRLEKLNGQTAHRRNDASNTEMAHQEAIPVSA